MGGIGWLALGVVVVGVGAEMVKARQELVAVGMASPSIFADFIQAMGDIGHPNVSTAVSPTAKGGA